MCRDVPKELTKFYPPDYEVDGLDILEIIRNKSEEFNILVSRKLKEMNLMDFEIEDIEKEIPVFDEFVFKVIYYAVEEMLKEFEKYENEYSILKYDVLLNIYTEYDIIKIAFCPKIETFIQGFPFEVPYRGLWNNGPGISFYFELSSCTVLKKVYMR